MVNLGQIAALKGEADLTVSTMEIEKFGEDRWRAGLRPYRRESDVWILSTRED